jgi:hypothetical protein
MKKFLLIGAAMMALPAAASAQDVTGTVAVDGSVAAKCKFTTPSETLSLGELAGTDGKLDVSKVDGQFKNLVGWCNGTASSMFVTAQPLSNAGTAPTGFANSVSYTASALANSQTATDTTAAGAGSPVTVGVFTGDIKVSLGSSSAGGLLLLAGAYNGSVTVTLSPAIALPPSD